MRFAARNFWTAKKGNPMEIHATLIYRYACCVLLWLEWAKRWMLSCRGEAAVTEAAPTPPPV